MEKNNRQLLFKQSIKSSLFAFVLSTVFVLILALIAKLCVMSPDILPIINQVLKAVAIAVAVILCIKDENMLLKALLCALFFSVFNCILYLCLGGKFEIGIVGIDFAIALVVASFVAILKARKRR